VIIWLRSYYTQSNKSLFIANLEGDKGYAETIITITIKVVIKIEIN